MKLPLPEQIHTDRLRLQRLKYEDAEEIFYTYASKPEATRYVSWPTHQSIYDTRRFLHYAAASWKNGTDYSYGVRTSGSNRLIGAFGVVNDNGKLQVGYIFSPTHWGRGFATEVCREMLQMLKTLEGISRIGTFVDCDNVASGRVLTKAGMVEETIERQFFRFVNQGNAAKDCVIYSLPLK